MAGYRPHDGAPYRLCGNVRVKARINELTRALAVKTRVTVETLTEEFNAAIELAKATGNPSAITGAALAKGKLHGLIVDRKESGAPGDFAGLQTQEQVLALLKAELGDEVAALLAAKLAMQESEVDQSPRDPNESLN